jgi:hypothetical protein
VRVLPLLCDERGQRRASRVALQMPRWLVEAANDVETLAVAKLGTFHGGLQHLDRTVVNQGWHRKGVTVLAAMGERKPRPVGKKDRPLPAFRGPPAPVATGYSSPGIPPTSVAGRQHPSHPERMRNEGQKGRGRGVGHHGLQSMSLQYSVPKYKTGSRGIVGGPKLNPR